MPVRESRTSALVVRITAAHRKLLDESVARRNLAKGGGMGLTRWMAEVAVLAAKIEHAVNDGGDRRAAVAELAEFLTPNPPRPEQA